MNDTMKDTLILRGAQHIFDENQEAYRLAQRVHAAAERVCRCGSATTNAPSLLDLLRNTEAMLLAECASRQPIAVVS
jgi:hypothetical protein